jgi:hypothetical protein
MPLARARSLPIVAVLLAAPSAASHAFAQNPDPPTVRAYCIKVNPGKSAEFEAFLRDVSLPLAQVRADSGEFAWMMVTRSLYPAGTSAPCDYSVVYGYKGLPPEEVSPASLDAALKKTKIPLTAEQMIAKRSSLITLVAAELWWGVEGTGPAIGKGGYMRVNHYKIKPGQWDEWVKAERAGWKPLVEEWNKAGGKGGWGVYGLVMPSGDAMPYDAATVDTFADWNGLIRGVPLDLWPKVHPGFSINETLANLDKTRSVHDVAISRIEAVVSPSAPK